MVLLTTNEKNPAALKLLIAIKYGQVDVQIKIVQVNGRSDQHLPYVELNNPEQSAIFIPNAALCYLLPPAKELAEVINEWLELEAHLASNLATSLGGSIKSEQSNVQSALKKLDSNLQGKTFICGNAVTAADIAFWSLLYPLYKDSKLCEKHLKDCTNITSWMGKLENEVHFKSAVSDFKVEPGLVSYTALLEGGKYFKNSSSVSNEVPSPQHTSTPQIEAVTAEELNAAKSSFNKGSSSLPKFKKQDGIILPVPGEKNVFISSALPYVNNVPHLGNIIGCVLSADVFARFSRLCNNNTLYIGGTDEYGTATETKALEEGLSCKEICDKYYAIHSDIYKWFNISFNSFGRSSSPEQTELCQALFLKLNDNGFMFTQAVEQLHCEKCDRYLADRFVEGGCPNVGCTYEDARGDQCDGCGKLVNAIELKNPRCKICGSTPKLKTSTQFFIDLPKLEPLIHHWIKGSAPGWSNNAQVIGKAWLKEGLKPRCITRDLKWGVEVPLDGFRSKVFYVWFDAPIGYISITKGYTKEYEKWWRPQKGTDVTMYQFMAKDNVPFHSILFPAMLLGANMNYVTVSHIMATEYLNYEDGKFSKSRGVGVFGTDARDTGIPSDVWRFYLLFVRPESQDASFSWADLATKNNSELLNNLGNFVNRALVFAKNNFNNSVPKIEPTEEDLTLLALCTREYKSYVAALEKAKLRDGIRHILAISRHGNQYLQMNQPWVLLKRSDEEKARAGTVIGICCNLACLLSILLHPYMPDTSASLKKQLNINDLVINASNPEIVQYVKASHKLGEPAPLFTKLEPDRIEELKKRFGGKQSEVKSSVSLDLSSIEAEVAKQADKVRLLKSSGAQKTVWQPEVAVLLELKKKLEAAQKSAKSEAAAPTKEEKPSQNGVNSTVDVKALQDEIDKQAALVRKLKESKSEKSVWQPEVEKLLKLKEKLSVTTGVPLPKSGKSKKK